MSKSLEDFLPEGAMIMDQIAVVSYLDPESGAERMVVAHGQVTPDATITMLEKAKLSVFLRTFFVAESEED